MLTRAFASAIAQGKTMSDSVCLPRVSERFVVDAAIDCSKLRPGLECATCEPPRHGFS